MICDLCKYHSANVKTLHRKSLVYLKAESGEMAHDDISFVLKNSLTFLCKIVQVLVLTYKIYDSRGILPNVIFPSERKKTQNTMVNCPFWQSTFSRSSWCCLRENIFKDMCLLATCVRVQSGMLGKWSQVGK